MVRSPKRAKRVERWKRWIRTFREDYENIKGFYREWQERNRLRREKVSAVIEKIGVKKVRAAAAVLGFSCLFFVACYEEYELRKAYYTVYVNGEMAGYAENKEAADEAVRKARIKLNSQTGELVLAEAKCVYRKEGNYVEKLTGEKELEAKILKGIESGVKNVQKAYLVKVANTTVALSNKEDIVNVLTEIKGPYDEENQYQVAIKDDEKTEMGVQKAEMIGVEKTGNARNAVGAGADGQVTSLLHDIFPVTISEGFQEKSEEEKIEDIPDSTLDFGKNVSVMETYVTKHQIAEEETAKEQILQNLPVLEQKKEVYQEVFPFETEYIYDDTMYAGTEEERVAGQDGAYETTALVSYNNGAEAERKILAQRVVKEPVKRIVHKGTKTQVSYIKPIVGGRFTSGFGSRWNSVHKGIDWATPIGTPVMASSAGTVTVAGAVSGYGYAVYITHEDGTKTRYGHLSEVQVEVGQKVKQGEQIALSGNTGRSTGPHVHFEILFDDVQVNPLLYIDKPK